jgi:small-conductance mechanosensitive channel
MLTLIQALQELLFDWLGDSTYAVHITNFILVVFTVFIYWLLYFIVTRVFRRLSQRVLKEDSRVQPLRIQKQEILSADEVAAILNRTFLGFSWFFRLWILFSFANTTLGLFEWTREGSEAMAGFVAGIVGGMWRSFIDYLPDLVTALIIIGFSYLIIKLFRQVFEGVGRRRIKVPGFYPEWSKTSYNLLRLMIIAMTVVVVFPYLPGSDSPAFQGVSIFFGVLLSLGSSTAVANVVAGIVITYTRAFRVGDYVRISDTEGKIIERTAFVTRIQTPKNVDVSLPNSQVMSITLRRPGRPASGFTPG